jgi:hypothetical protein
MNKTNIIAASLLCLALISHDGTVPPTVAEVHIQPMLKMDDAKFKDWLSRWQANIRSNVSNNYCTKEMGEDMGWIMFPMLKGFYYGYLTTKNPDWVTLFLDCTDSWMKRAVVEPDGYIGWPKVGAAGTTVDDLDDFYADSILGEALVLRYVALMSELILKTPSLDEKFSAKAKSYLAVAEQIFEKWDKRGAWRETKNGGMISVELPYGIDKKTWTWTDSYQERDAPGNGFSHPDNKANLVACWLIAMFDATQKPIYKERAEKWFRIMKSRMKLDAADGFRIWSYWEPAGPWDYRMNFLPKHWVGVHPNGEYYEIDVDSVVTAYEHGLVFDRADIGRLITIAMIQQRYWRALAPYSNRIQKYFEDYNNPNSWNGLSATPWYLARQIGLN